jgi:hypothetical protein
MNEEDELRTTKVKDKKECKEDEIEKLVRKMFGNSRYYIYDRSIY